MLFWSAYKATRAEMKSSSTLSAHQKLWILLSTLPEVTHNNSYGNVQSVYLNAN